MVILASNILKLMVIEHNQAYSPYKRVPFGDMAMCGLKKLFTKGTLTRIIIFKINKH
jgi:hypothetical protein